MINLYNAKIRIKLNLRFFDFNINLEKKINAAVVDTKIKTLMQANKGEENIIYLALNLLSTAVEC